MPAYNAEKYIGRAIDSILNQSYQKFELIIVNDASTDKTLNIIRKYAKRDKRIRYISNKKNKLIAHSLNKGIQMSYGEIIARMDGDDESMPDRLEKQLKVLLTNKKTAVVGADLDVVNTKGKKISKRTYPVESTDLKRLMFRYSPFSHPVVMYRKNAFLEFGGYREDIFPAEDIDLWFKLGSKYDFASVSEPLLKYTFIPNSSSHRKLKKLELLTFKIRLSAIIHLGYRPSFYDVIYNLLQLSSAYLTPPKLRVEMYDFLRKHEII
jgi:glycosyltransferase involved in cell wall biosynthesis